MRKSLHDVVVEKYSHVINDNDFNSIESEASYHLLRGFTIEECVDAAISFHNKHPFYIDDPVACFAYGMGEYLRH